MLLHIHLISNLDELDTYTQCWATLDRLQYNSLSVFSAYAYVRAFLQTHRPEQWAVAHLLDKQHPDVSLGFIPFQLRSLTHPKPSPLKLAIPLGARYVPYIDYLIHPDYRLQVWNAVTSLFRNHLKLDGALIGPSHQTSLNYAHLLQHFSSETLKQISFRTHHQLDTRLISDQQYRKNRPNAAIKDVERCLRRLGEQGDVRIVQPADDDHIDRTFVFIAENMRQQFKDQLLYSDLDAWMQMYRLMYNHQSEQHKVEITTLTLNNQTIAATVGLVYKDRRTLIMTAYDPKYRKFSAGKILLNRHIAQTFEEKRIFCFGAGDHAYKKHWSEQNYTLNVLGLMFTEKAKEHWTPFFTREGINPLVQTS